MLWTLGDTERRMGIATFLVNAETLAKALQLPEDITITNAEWSILHQAIRLLVQGPQLPEHKPGYLLVDINSSITEQDGKITWHWPSDSC